MSDVFISYSVDAKPWAEKVSESLEKKVVSTWTDFKDVRSSEHWREQMERALDEAKCFLIVVGRERR